MENNIWLDVTTTLNWSRPAVGIIRMESECASFFLKTDFAYIHFCRYDLRNKQYIEVHRDEIENALERIQQFDHNALSYNVSIEQRVKNLIKRMINHLPAKQRHQAYIFSARQINEFRAIIRAYGDIHFAFRELISSSSILNAPLQRLFWKPQVKAIRYFE